MTVLNGALAHMPLALIHTSLPDLRSQVGLNSRVDKLTWRVDNQNNLISQLLRQINLNQGLDLGSRDKERRMHEHIGEDADICKPSSEPVNDRLGPQSIVHARLGPQRSIHSRLGPQGARVREQLRDRHND
ncbi:unnamed protein product [Prunus brigantina]